MKRRTSSKEGMIQKLRNAVYNQIQFMIETIDQNLNLNSTWLDKIILFFSSQQIFSYQKNYYQICDINENETSFNSLELFQMDKILWFIAKPIQAINTTNTLNYVPSIRQIISIFSIAYFPLLMVIQILIHHYSMKQNARRILCLIYSYMIVYFNEYIMLNMLDNAYLSVKYSSSSSSAPYILGLIVIILASIFAIFMEIFCILSIHINGKGILKVFQGKLSICRVLIRIAIPGIAFSFANQANCNKTSAFVSVYVFSLVYVVTSVMDEILNHSYNDIGLVQAYFAGLSLSVSLTSFKLFQFANAISYKNAQTLAFIVAPCVYLCLLQIHKSKIFKILQTPDSMLVMQRKFDELAIKMSFLSRYRKTLHLDNLSGISIAGILARHREECRDELCFCQKYNSNSVHFISEESGIAIDLKMLDKYVISTLENHILFSPQHKLSQFQAQFRFIKYISLLKQGDQLTNAAQKISSLLFSNKSSELSFYTLIILRLYMKLLSIQIKSQPSKTSFTLNNMSASETQLQAFTFSNAIARYIRSESLFESILESVLNVLDLKINFYQNIQLSKEGTGKQLNLVCERMMSVEKDLNMLYKRFPSDRNRTLICFFEAEIHSNFLRAYNLTNGITGNNGNVAQQYRDNETEEYAQNSYLKRMNLFDNENVVSIQVSYGKRKGEIITYSDAAPSFFGYDQQQFAYIKHINDLIPKTIARTHEEFLLNFLVTSESKFFKDINLSFFQNKDGYIVPIDFTVDINFHFKEDFAFIAFLKKKQFQANTSYLILDSNGMIEGVTDDFQDKILLSNEDEKLLQEQIYLTNFTAMIPDFPDLIKDMNLRRENVRHFDKQIMYFFKTLQYSQKHSSTASGDFKGKTKIIESSNGIPDQESEFNSGTTIKDNLPKTPNKNSTISIFQQIKTVRQMRQNYSISSKKITNHIGKLNRAIINQFDVSLRIFNRSYILQGKKIQYFIIEFTNIKRFFVKTMQMSNILKQIMDKRSGGQGKTLDNSSNSGMDTTAFLNSTPFISKHKIEDFDPLAVTSSQAIKQSAIKKSSIKQTGGSLDDLDVILPGKNQLSKRVFIKNETSNKLDKQLSKQLSKDLKNAFDKFDDIKQFRAVGGTPSNFRNKNEEEDFGLKANSNLFTASGKQLGLRLLDDDYLFPPEQIQQQIKDKGSQLSIKLENEHSFGMEVKKIQTEKGIAESKELENNNLEKREKKRRSTSKTSKQSNKGKNKKRQMSYSSTSQPMDKLFSMIKALNSGTINTNIRGEQVPGERRITQINASKEQFNFQKSLSFEGMEEHGNEEKETNDGDPEEESDETQSDNGTEINQLVLKKQATHRRFIRRQMHQQVFYSQGAILHEKEPSETKDNLNEDLNETTAYQTGNQGKSVYCKTIGREILPSKSKQFLEIFKGTPADAKEQEMQGMQDIDKQSSLIKFRVSEFYEKYLLFENFTSPKLSKKNSYLNRTLQMQALCFLVMCSMPLYFMIEQTSMVSYLKNQIELFNVSTGFLRNQNEMHLSVQYQYYLSTTSQTVVSKTDKITLNAQVIPETLLNAINLQTTTYLSSDYQSAINSFSANVLISDNYSTVLVASQVIMSMVKNMIEISQGTNMATVIASSGYQFYLNNVQTILTLMQEINQDLKTNTYDSITDSQNSTVTAFIIFTVLLTMIILIQLYCFRLFCLQQLHQKELFEHTDLNRIQIDLEKLQFIQQLLQKQQEILFIYEFDLHLKEEILKQETQRRILTKQRKKQNQRNNLELDGKQVPQTLFITLQAVTLIMFVAFGLIVYLYFHDFVTVYRNNLVTLNDYSSFQYLLPELSLLWVVINKNTNAVQRAEEITIFSSELTLFSNILRSELAEVQIKSNLPQSFITEVELKNNANLCTDEQLTAFGTPTPSLLITQLCPLFIKSALTKGLLSSVVNHQNYFRNLVYLDFSLITDYFQIGSVESIFIVDQYISNLQAYLISQLKSTSNSTVIVIYVSSILFLIFLFFYNLLFFAFTRKRMQHLDLINRNGLFLIPQQTLFLDPRFITRLRAYLLKFNLTRLIE